MGTVYPRGKSLWLGFRGPDGKWRYRPSGYRLGQEKLAKQALRAIEARVRQDGPAARKDRLTLKAFGEEWCKARKGSDEHWNAAREEGQLENHVYPLFGHLELDAVRPSHIREILSAAKLKKLAPRTRSNLYGVLHRLFGDAAADELIVGSPCALRRGELPKRVDKDPTWRSKAVFTRAEAERLVSDSDIPLDRRVVYGLAFASGLREGEIGALRWHSLDFEREPLALLMCSASWNRYHKREKAPKSGRERPVPVHPTLRRLLNVWKASGYAEHQGKPPHPDDLVVPNSLGKHRSEQSILRDFKADLEALKFRHRRFHDCRRTFISLALAGGAHEPTLKRISHGPEGKIIDLYNTPPWEALCQAVLCLRLELREGLLLHSFPTAEGKR